jgi:hypothetical protein
MFSGQKIEEYLYNQCRRFKSSKKNAIAEINESLENKNPIL